MACRFHCGGRLIAFGRGPSAADAAHVVVEFVHPVIIGKRALPALALPGGPAGFPAELELFGEPDDIAVAFAPDGSGVADALAVARDRGMLTVALLGDSLAVVDTGEGVEEVSVALVDAAVGDTVLVHAGEAIARVTGP